MMGLRQQWELMQQIIFLIVMNTNESSALQSDALFRQHNIYPWAEFVALLIMGILAIIIMKKFSDGKHSRCCLPEWSLA